MRLLTTLLITASLLCLNLQARADDAENPYATAYKPLELRARILPPETPEPQIYKGSGDKDADYQRMLEQGFDLLGYSSFEAGEVPAEKLMEHAKAVNAHLVLVTSQRSGDVPASIKIDQLRKKAREQNTDTIDLDMLDQSSVRYAYHASYWVKLAPPLIGLHVRPPAKEEKEPGLIVVAVINNSPADKALLQELDVIKSIGDVVLESPEALTKAAQRYAGQTVEVVYMRQGAINKTTMTLNRAY
ncbi:MAG: PDZ domain-containing protein [Betaproteobacteria bacterium HGW-Betaproteobacteria-8]|nr:MAG: PDZ domain-containing protein [Betaproteobacteria bacterium HGW-Betaproteobacteria-8]